MECRHVLTDYPIT